MQPSLRRLSVNAALRKPQKDLGKWSRPESAPPPPTGPPRAPLTQSLPSNASYNSSPGPNRNQAPRLPPSDYAARREPTGSTQNQRVWRKGDPLSPSTVSSSSSPLPSTPAPPVQPQIDWKNWKPEPKPEFASSRAPYVPRRSTPVRPESSQSWTRQEQQQKPFRPDRFPQPAKVEQPRQYNNANAAASAFAKSLQKQLHEEKLSTDVASEAPTSTDGLRMGQQTSDWRTAITQDGRDSRVQRDQTTDVSQVERDWRPEMNQDGRDSRVQTRRDQTTDVSQVERDWRTEIAQDERRSRVQGAQTTDVSQVERNPVTFVDSDPVLFGFDLDAAPDVREARPRRINNLKPDARLARADDRGRVREVERERERDRSFEEHDGDRHDKEKRKGKERVKLNEDGDELDIDQIEKKKKKKKVVQPKVIEVRQDIFVPEMISVGNLAKLLDVSMRDLQNTMILQGMEENASHDQILSYEYASLLVGEFGKTAVMNEEAAFDIYPAPAPADTSKFVARPPVVTIMGHVDHGKTTLLDSLRSTSVAKGEAGGITQHIGAFSVPVKASGGKQTITFLDTPGHAAFSAMRARGASVTDIIVLVVAADDGVMAQTKEVINLIKKDIDNVGVVVALNKIDREGADPDSVRLELMAEGIELESHGGDIPAVEVSGLSGKGLDDLVETIAAVSELMDLRADRQSLLQGAILESRVVKGVGATATVLVHSGTLQPGAHLICGTTSCKVRMMTDHTGKSIKVAYPGEAVNVAGWSEIPSAGDDVLQSTSEKDIRRALENRIRRAQSSAMVNDAAAINAFRRAAKEQHEAALAAKAAAKEAGQPLPDPANDIRKEESSGPKQLRIVLKADVSGSVEAVIGALEAITHPAAHAKVIHSGVGDVTESDLELATTAGGIVIAFNVKCPRPIEQAAVKAGVAIHSSGIIYRLTDEVRKQVSKLIPPIIEHSVIGVANLLQLFEVEQRGKKDKLQVCGCRISNGVVKKGSLARVIRGKDVVFEGKIDTLRHHKDLVQELIRGQECGLTIEGFTEGKTGDIIQVITTVEKPVQI